MGNSCAEVRFVNPSIHYGDDETDNIYRCCITPTDDQSLRDLQTQLNQLISDPSHIVTIWGNSHDGKSWMRLELTSPVRIEADVSYRNQPISKLLGKIDAGVMSYLGRNRTAIHGVVISGEAKNIHSGRPVWYSIWPVLGTGVYVDRTNFVNFDERGRMIRPGSDADPLVDQIMSPLSA